MKFQQNDYPMKRLNILIGLLFICLGTFSQTRVDSIRDRLFNPNDKSILVASHRGDWRNACENSLEAIENAIKIGVDIVEVDLARTKDGQLILMHDSKLDRTTTGKGLISEHTLAEIKNLRLRNGCHIKTIYKVPTLEEALLVAKGRVMLNLDKAFDLSIHTHWTPNVKTRRNWGMWVTRRRFVFKR